jgi:hypothetical protein
LPWAENGTAGVQLLFLAPAVVCIAAGLTVPFLGPRALRAWRRQVTFRRLGPLASALAAASPHGFPQAAARPRGGDVRLLTRVIGIRDCLIGPLRSHLDPELYAAAYGRAIAEGMCGNQATAIAEATCIGAALRGSRALAPTFSRQPPTLRLGADLDAEAAWLAEVSQAYAHSQLVRRLIESG